MIRDETTIGPVRIILGNSLEVIPTLKQKQRHIKAVVTDPPYIVGASSIGNPRTKSGTWADMENAAYWFAEWFRLCVGVMRPDFGMAVFGNWRTLPTLLCAGSKAQLMASSCVVWDKAWIGTAHESQFRPTWELFVLFTGEGFTIADRSCSDVWSHKWMASQSGEFHPAEKPVELLERIVRHLARSGDTVLDPFAGSGSTLVAAARFGCQAIGIEADENHYRTAVDRVKEAWGIGTLFDDGKKQ